MEVNSFSEKTFVVGTQFQYVPTAHDEAIQMRTNNIMCY